MKNTRHFPVVVEQDNDGVFIVECPILERCRIHGETLDIALENIREAILVCLDEQQVADDTVFLGIRDIEIVV